MECPADRVSIGWSIDRPLLAAALAAVLLSVQPAKAQNRDADAELEALIPDSAIEGADEWARVVPPAEPSPEAVLDPQSPLSESEDFSLPWPDEGLELPSLAGLEPEPDTGLAAGESGADAGTAEAGGDATRVSSRLTLMFPADAAAFPERTEFESRFRRLSTIERLSGEGDDSIAQLAVRARSDGELLRRMLRIYGYYDSEVIQSFSGIEPGQDVADKDVRVRFDILPGRRFRFGVVDTATLEDTGEDYGKLRAAFGISPGDPLRSDRIVAARTGLEAALGESGYPFAKLGEPELLVDHRREEGDLTQPVTPGGKYNFGRITSDKPRFLSARHLEEIARFEPGDLYRRTLSEDLRRAILATGLVSSVSVTPRETRAPTAGQPGEVALDVSVAKAPLRTIAGAVGYDSGDGPRLEASWEHRNFFPPEGKLRLRAVAGTKEQLAGITFRRNNFHGRDQVLTLDLYGDTVERDAYDARTLGFSATFEKLTTLIFQKPWTWSAGLEMLASNEREGDVGGISTARNTYYIAAVPLRAAFDGSNDLLDPTRGFRASLRISPELSIQGGRKAAYARIQADASVYRPLGGKVVLAARARLGSIPGTSIANIAPSRRFYAGGGGSVRGYGYQLIGPRDSLGEPSGGRSLSEFSLEARIRTGMFDGALSFVPFVDAGAVDVEWTPRLRDIRYGAGIGIRYQTSFGPLRLDVGTPLNRRPGESRIGVYVSLGQAF